MPGASATLSIVLKLVDDATSALTSTADKWKSAGETMTSIGSSLTAEVTLPIVGIGYAAVNAASQFQASMTQLVTQAGLPADQLQNLTNQVLAFANSGAQQTPEVLAQGLYHIVSLGVPAANAMSVLKLASEGAAVGGANLEDVANALGAAVASNIKGSDNYEQSMAILNATVGAGNMRMQDLATSLGNVLPQATTAGLSLKDVGAAMATMTDNGMPAADAATRLHMAISLMEAPTGKAQKALESIGVTQFQLADDMRNKGLLPALQDLHDHLINSGKTADQQAAIITAAFGGGRSAGAIELLLNNLDRLGQKYQLIDQGVNKFGADVSQQSQTSAALFAEGTSKMQAASIELGDALKGPVGAAFIVIADAISKLAEGFSALPQPIQYGIIAVLGLAAVIGPLLVIFGTLIATIGTIAVALGIGALALFGWIALIAIVIAAAVALAVAIYENWDKIKSFITQHWDAIVNLLVPGLGSLVKLFVDNWQQIADFIAHIWQTIVSDTEAAISKVQSLVNSLMAPINDARNAINSVGSILSGGASSVLSSVPHFAQGGIVTGPTYALIGEAGPEAVIPLSSFAGGSSLRGTGGGAAGSIVVNIMGGNYLDSSGATMIANAIGKQVLQQLKLRNYS